MWYYYLMSFLGRMRRLYFMQVPETNDQYRISRRYLVFEGVANMSILMMVTGAIFAGYLKYIGVPDSINGIILAIPTMAALLQPISAIYVEKLKHRKLFVSLLALIHRLLFAAVFIIPVFVKDPTARIIVTISTSTLAFIFATIMGPAASNWLVNLTPSRIRGRYFSSRERMLIIFSSILSFAIGYTIDKFTAMGMRDTAYHIISAVCVILAISSFYFFSRTMEPEIILPAVKLKLYDIFAKPFFDRNFRSIIVLNILWNLSFQIAAPSMAIYQVSILKLNYTYIMFVVFAVSVFKVTILKSWGKFADRTSWTKVCEVAMGWLSIVHLSFFFLIPSNAIWLFFILCIGTNVSWAVLGIAIFNIQFDYAPEEGRTIYLATNAAIGGIFGFGIAFVGSWIIKLMDKLNLQLFNTKLEGQQVLMVISGLMLMSCVFYIRQVISNMEKPKEYKKKRYNFM